MKLSVYVLRDRVALTSNVILTANNDDVLKRDIKGVLLGQQQNVINTNTEDKDIYQVGELDTDTGKLVANEPVFVFNIEVIRKELVKEIRIKKAEAGITEEGDQDERESTSEN